MQALFIGAVVLAVVVFVNHRAYRRIDELEDAYVSIAALVVAMVLVAREAASHDRK